VSKGNISVRAVDLEGSEAGYLPRLVA